MPDSKNTTNLASFGLLNEKVKKIFEEEGCESKGIAFMRFGLSSLLKLNEDEIEEALTDGPDDGEIDAVYINKRSISLITFKYTDDFDLTKKNFPGTDIDQFCYTVDRIISGDLDKKTVNTALWEKYQEIRRLAKDGQLNFKILVVSNKMHPVSTSKRKIDALVKKFHLGEQPVYYNQEEIVSSILASKVKKIDGKVTFVDRQHFEKSNGDIKTIIGVIPGVDLINLIKDKIDPKRIDEDIFNENIRVYKAEHSVNEAIMDSARADTNYQFFYLNNGITLLCEQEDYMPNTKSPTVNLRTIQIINGGQTSHSLFLVHLSEPEKIENLELLVRICIPKSNGLIGEKISESTNNQIPVANRDLHANDEIQRKLEEEFKELGYFYERKPNQHSDKPKNSILNNELLGQLYMAYYLDLPSEAKNNKSRVFSDLYESIFDHDEINATKLLGIYKMYLPLLEMKKTIQAKKRKKETVEEKEAFISRATFHILSGMKYLIEKRKLLILSESISNSKKQQKISNVPPDELKKIQRKVISVIRSVVKKEIKSRGELYTHDKFFKEIPTNTIIRDAFSKVKYPIS